MSVRSGRDRPPRSVSDRKSTRLNSSHGYIFTLSLHDALPILQLSRLAWPAAFVAVAAMTFGYVREIRPRPASEIRIRSEEHTSELQSRLHLHSFPPRRSSDLATVALGLARRVRRRGRDDVRLCP